MKRRLAQGPYGQTPCTHGRPPLLGTLWLPQGSPVADQKVAPFSKYIFVVLGGSLGVPRRSQGRAQGRAQVGPGSPMGAPGTSRGSSGSFF